MGAEKKNNPKYQVRIYLLHNQQNIGKRLNRNGEKAEARKTNREKGAELQIRLILIIKKNSQPM